jgi:hypothetical protein
LVKEYRLFRHLLYSLAAVPSRRVDHGERSIHHQETVLVVRLLLYPQGFDEKTVVAGRLKDIDAAGFHGGTGAVAMQTRVTGEFRTFLASDAGTG